MTRTLEAECQRRRERALTEHKAAYTENVNEVIGGMMGLVERLQGRIANLEIDMQEDVPPLPGLDLLFLGKDREAIAGIIESLMKAYKAADAYQALLQSGTKEGKQEDEG